MMDPSSLHEAVLLEDMESVEKLIAEGADVNKVNGSRRTPLDYCVSLTPCFEHIELGKETEVFKKDSRLKMVQLLLNAGADPNIADLRGWTLVHQCAHNGDLPLLQLLVRKGGKVGLRNSAGELPVNLAVYRGHLPVVRYLEQQVCDIRSLCRLSIRDTMGKRTYNRINELPLPPSIKLFVNYGVPYNGWQATLVPPAPWSDQELQEGGVKVTEIQRFIREHATGEFVEDHCEVLGGDDMVEVVEAFQTLYLWEAFQMQIDYQEPLARKPNYSMEMLKKKDGGVAEEGRQKDNGGVEKDETNDHDQRRQPWWAFL